MKTKIMLISILTAACVFVFSGATWADGKKDRHHSNPKQKRYTVSKYHKPERHQNQWKKGYRYYGKKNQSQKRSHLRAKHHRHESHDRDYRHTPYYKRHAKQWRYYKSRHYIHRPAIKHQRHKHLRPVYSRRDGNVSILTSTSHHGWSIKISSKD